MYDFTTKTSTSIKNMQALSCWLWVGGVAALPVSSQGMMASTDAAMPIWLPILLVVAAVAVLSVCMWTRRIARRNVAAHLSSGAVPASPQSVTADQLAGRNRGTGSRTRRTRRARRTPSQISTKSLPAYMKEPGDHELVIIRGVQDMEDGTVLPETDVMPSVAEQDTENYPHSRNNSNEFNEASRSPSAPLLQGDSPNNADHLAQQSSTSADNRSSMSGSNSMSESDETNDQALSDPRGEAPAYTEEPPLHQQQHSIATTAQTIRADPSPAATQSQSNSGTPVGSTAVRERRRSGFRVLLDAFSNSLPTSRAQAPNAASSTGGHTRSPTNQSTTATTTHQSERSQSPRTFHRPSHSGGSIPGVSGFRPPSSRSNNNIHGHRMNSPSQISLQSISAPLTHTVVRTDFTYPKSGPTPEQLKFLSSRESLGRFGVPYGPDAIAYAESTSRDDPPPDFDAPRTSTSSQFHAERRGMPVNSPLSSEVIAEGDSAATSPLSSSARLELARNNPLPVESLTVAPGPASGLRPPAQVPPSAQITGGLPPTSFRPPASSFIRSESRASSFLSTATYRTALETMSGGSNTDGEADNTDAETNTDGESITSPTPMMLSHHVPEGTNTTITAAPASA